MDALVLADFARPLKPIEFPNGETRPCVAFDAIGHKLVRKIWSGAASDEEIVTALKLAVPEATEDDWGSLDDEGVFAGVIFAHAARKGNLALQLLKNAASAAAASSQAPTAPPPAPPRSSRRTRKGTSSPASPPPPASPGGA